MVINLTKKNRQESTAYIGLLHCCCILLINDDDNNDDDDILDKQFPRWLSPVYTNNSNRNYY